MPHLGGVICERCPGPSYERTGLSLDGLKLLKAYQRLDIEAIAALRLAETTEREVEAAMREFISNALERAGALACVPRRGPGGGLTGRDASSLAGSRLASAIAIRSWTDSGTIVLDGNCGADGSSPRSGP